VNIYILRHGEAEAQQTSDEARRLTERGRRETYKVLQAAQSRMPNVLSVWASPLIRAQQTAVIAQEFLGGAALETCDFIVPEANPSLLYQRLNEFCERYKHLPSAGLLLVSHQPLVGYVLNQLCGSENGFYPMATSSLAALRCQDVVAPSLADFLWLECV
jgi:phosphohistidine phosphatase